jgi:hypothetical protein
VLCCVCTFYIPTHFDGDDDEEACVQNWQTRMGGLKGNFICGKWKEAPRNGNGRREEGEEKTLRISWSLGGALI